MRVLGVGLSKTGTTSLHRALQILGYRSLHYDDKRLNDVVHGETTHPDFRRYDDVDAVLDIPSAYFFDELLDAYPRAKCILTLRDEDAWWKSIRFHFNEKSPVARREDDPFKWDCRSLVFGSAKATEYLFRKRYREHNERVRRRVPLQRLLVMRITDHDGWDQLCPFLDQPVPEVPFPVENRSDTAEAQCRAIEELSSLLPPGGIVVLVDEETLGRPLLEGRAVLPFLERDGAYWGLPPDAETAIRELERMRRAGATHIAFAWPAFWWLGYYSSFEAHLRSSYLCVLRNERLLVFDLASRPRPRP